VIREYGRRALRADANDLQDIEAFPVKSAQKPPRIIQIFFSYAQADEKLRDKLEEQLIILKHQGLKIGWYDSEITAGKDCSGACVGHRMLCEYLWRHDTRRRLHSTRNSPTCENKHFEAVS